MLIDTLKRFFHLKDASDDIFSVVLLLPPERAFYCDYKCFGPSAPNLHHHLTGPNPVRPEGGTRIGYTGLCGPDLCIEL